MTDKIMSCKHNLSHTELIKISGIVYCIWVCVEGCRATEQIGEAYQWDTLPIDED